MAKLAFVLVGCLFLLVDFSIPLQPAMGEEARKCDAVLAGRKGVPSRGRVGAGTRLVTVLEVDYV